MKTDLNGVEKLHQGQGPFFRSALAYLFFLPGAVPVKAHQIKGTPGSPEATQKSNLKAGLALGAVVMLITLAAFGEPNPGKFTTFASYEWTAMPNNMNLHRNVFFKDTVHIPEMPFTALDSPHPEDLWNWMDAERKKGNELLCISHNANLSDGRMFPIDVDSFGRPIDAAWAASRDRNERLTEIKQIKGQSETHPLLSPNDEFANDEILSCLLGGPEGRIPHIFGSYVRQAYKDGLTMQDTAGYNPYKVGVVGASDSHEENSAVSSP